MSEIDRNERDMTREELVAENKALRELLRLNTLSWTKCDGDGNDVGTTYFLRCSSAAKVSVSETPELWKDTPDAAIDAALAKMKAKEEA